MRIKELISNGLIYLDSYTYEVSGSYIMFHRGELVTSISYDEIFTTNGSYPYLSEQDIDLKIFKQCFFEDSKIGLEQNCEEESCEGCYECETESDYWSD